MDNKDVVRAVEEAWDGQDLDALDQYFAPEFDNSTSAVPGLPPGLAGAKMAHQGAMQSFPDRKVNIEEIVGDGDRVAIRTRVTGTNDGGFPLFNVPANGAKIDFPAVSIYRLRDAKIVGHWGLNDALTLMMQLGAIQPPA
jgi:predicted ester cyclase